MQAFEDNYFSKMGPRSSSAFGKTRESCQKQKRHDMSAPVRAQPGKESVPASRIKSCDTTKFISKHSNEGKMYDNGSHYNKVDKLWTDIWTGGLTNPLTRIE